MSSARWLEGLASATGAVATGSTSSSSSTTGAGRATGAAGCVGVDCAVDDDIASLRKPAGL